MALLNLTPEAIALARQALKTADDACYVLAEIYSRMVSQENQRDVALERKAGLVAARSVIAEMAAERKRSTKRPAKKAAKKTAKRRTK